MMAVLGWVVFADLYEFGAVGGCDEAVGGVVNDVFAEG